MSWSPRHSWHFRWPVERGIKPLVNGKRCLFLIDSLAAGGAERVVLSLGQVLHELGHEVTILTIQDRIELPVDFPVRLVSLGFQKRRGELSYRKYARRLRTTLAGEENTAGAYDLVVANLQIANRLVALSRIPETHLCIHSALSPGSLGNRRGLRRYLKRRKLRRIFNRQHVITIAKGMRDDLLTEVGAQPKSIQVIYNAVDFHRVRRLASGENQFAGENYIVCPARFADVKRHDRLLEAYQRSGISQRLLLLGTGEMEQRVRQMVHDKGLSGRVIFAGFHHNPYPIMKDAAATILASDYEGLPTVLIESLALGTPVVSTDCPSGPREIMLGDLARFLAPVNDVGALAKKIKMAVQEGSTGSINLADARLERFEPVNVANQYLSLADRRKRLGVE